MCPFEPDEAQYSDKFRKTQVYLSQRGKSLGNLHEPRSVTSICVARSATPHYVKAMNAGEPSHFFMTHKFSRQSRQKRAALAADPADHRGKGLAVARAHSVPSNAGLSAANPIGYDLRLCNTN